MLKVENCFTEESKNKFIRKLENRGINYEVSIQKFYDIDMTYDFYEITYEE